MNTQSVFFGREKEIDRFKEISIKKFEPLKIIGIHGSGKTFFCQQIASKSEIVESETDIKIFHVLLFRNIEKPADFYSEVAKIIDGEPNTSEPSGQSKIAYYKDFEKFIKKQTDKQKLLILLDGFDHIMVSDLFQPSFFFELRALMINYPIRWITSLLTSSFDEEVEKKSNYFFNVFGQTPLYLGEMDDISSRDFVSFLMKKRNHKISDTDIGLILTISGRLPYFIEQTVRFWVDSRNEFNHKESDSFRKKIIDTFLSPDNEVFKQLKNINNAFSKDEANSIIKILNSPEKINRRETSNIENILVQYGIFKVNETGFVEIASELFRSFFSEPDALQKKTFDFNLDAKILLQQLEVKNFHFFGDFNWEFQPGVNILLGKNGYGKSHLLRLIVSHLQNEGEIADENFFRHSQQGAFVKLHLERNDIPETIHKIKNVFVNEIGKIPVLAIPDLRYLDKSRTSITMLTDEIDGDLSEIGAYHFIREKSYTALVENFFYTFCKDYFIEGSKDEPMHEVLKRYPLGRLLEDIIYYLTDEGFDFSGIETPPGINKYRIEVITDGNKDYPLPIQKVSQGTLSILIMFGLIHNYLKTIYEKSNKTIYEKSENVNFNNGKGIVFIDEIDAHLHPAWQQKIVGLLRKTFPNVQFVLSSHSPLVVAGCKEREVVVMRKEDKEFTLHQFENDFIGYTATEIYERIFEIDPFDDDYKMYLSRIYEIPEIEKRIEELKEKIEEKQILLENADSDIVKNKEDLKVFHGELGEKYDDLHYINKAKRKYDKNKEFDRLFMENRKLKYDLEKERSKNKNL